MYVVSCTEVHMFQGNLLPCRLSPSFYLGRYVTSVTPVSVDVVRGVCFLFVLFSVLRLILSDGFVICFMLLSKAGFHFHRCFCFADLDA